jgi:hypothetical protein
MPIEPFIDAHSHIWTPDLAHYPLAQGFTVENMKPPSFTAEELLSICRPASVGRVNLIQMSFYAFDNRDSTHLTPDTGPTTPLLRIFPCTMPSPSLCLSTSPVHRKFPGKASRILVGTSFLRTLCISS